MKRSPALPLLVFSACLGCALPARATPPPGTALPPIWHMDGAQGGAELGWATLLVDVNHDGYDDVILGAPQYDGAAIDAGRVQIFLGGANGPAQGASWTFQGAQASDGLGSALAVGDWNADGWIDLAVGAPRSDVNGPDAGRVLVFPGTLGGLAPAPDHILDGDVDGAQFGFALAGDGDLNGDGREDLVIGAPFGAHAEFEPGRAFVYFGAAAGLGTKASHTFSTFVLGAEFGYALALADVNGDGTDDLCVGAPGTDWVPNKLGMVWIYRGGPVFTSDIYDWFTLGDVYGRYGESIAAVGDANGDGIEDLLVGAPRWGGKVFLHYGTPNGPLSTALWTSGAIRTGDNEWAGFGSAVAGAGDVNEDGYDDFIVSGPYGAAGYCDAPTPGVFLYLGGAPKPEAAPLWGACHASTCSLLGRGLCAGDANGDGRVDILAGDPRSDAYAPGDCASAGYGSAYLYSPMQAVDVPPPALGSLDFRLVSENPVREAWTVEWALKREGVARLEVRDVRGALVTSREIASAAGEVRRERVDLGNAAPSGVYWIRLLSPAGTRTVQAVRVR